MIHEAALELKACTKCTSGRKAESSLLFKAIPSLQLDHTTSYDSQDPTTSYDSQDPTTSHDSQILRQDAKKR